MSTYPDETILSIIKARLNRLPEDCTLDDYLRYRIEAAREELERTGIKIRPESADDAMLLVDTVVWQYSNRDAQNGMPEWLRLKRRERWLAQREGGESG